MEFARLDAPAHLCDLIRSSAPSARNIDVSDTGMAAAHQIADTTTTCYCSGTSFAVGNAGAGYGPSVEYAAAQKSGGPSLSATRLRNGFTPYFR